jgi:hypothetical protein
MASNLYHFMRSIINVIMLHEVTWNEYYLRESKEKTKENLN